MKEKQGIKWQRAWGDLHILRVMIDVNQFVSKNSSISASSKEPDALSGNGIGGLQEKCERNWFEVARRLGISRTDIWNHTNKHTFLFSLNHVKMQKAEMTRKDGSTIHVMKNAAVIEEGGDFIGAVETITELVEKESQIEAYRRELQSELLCNRRVATNLKPPEFLEFRG